MLYKEELDSSIIIIIMEITWSSLDDQLCKQMLQSVLDGLKLRNPGGLAPGLKDINNSLT